MNRLASLRFWACAAVYVAIGIVGVVFLNSRPNIASAADGYATVRVMAPK